MGRVHETQSQQVETLLQLGGLKRLQLGTSGLYPGNRPLVARSEMTQQMQRWTSPKSVNPNPISVLALHI
jgi:hypothetical protein